MQSGIFVAGVEADWIWTGIRGHGFGDTGVFENFNRTDVTWLATVTGRVGVVPWTRALLYGKAGAAAAEVHNQNRQAVPAFASAEVSGTSVVPGYVFGVGLEHMLAGNWSARLEYDYVTLFNGGQVQEGALNFFGSPASAAATNQIKQSPQMVKLGINYRFAPPPP